MNLLLFNRIEMNTNEIIAIKPNVMVTSDREIMFRTFVIIFNFYKDIEFIFS